MKVGFTDDSNNRRKHFVGKGAEIRKVMCFDSRVI
jgi:hypothetical protein